MAWPCVKLVYHEGKHLEELEEGTSHNERERDSIPALCGENVSREVFGQSQHQTRLMPVTKHNTMQKRLPTVTTSVKGAISKVSQGTLQRAPAIG